MISHYQLSDSLVLVADMQSDSVHGLLTCFLEKVQQIEEHKEL